MRQRKISFIIALSLAVLLYTGCDIPGSSIEDSVFHTITFESNGGSSVASMEILQGGVITEPSPPSKENHLFAGWFKDSSFNYLWDFSNSIIDQDVTLYAKWTAVSVSPWELIGSAGISAGEADTISLKIDNANNPVIAYRDYENNKKITVKQWNSISSQWEVLGSEGFSVSDVQWISLDLDSTNIPYVAYFNPETGGQTVMKWDSGSSLWSTLLNSSSGRFEYGNLLLSSDDSPVLAYSDSNGGLYQTSVYKWDGSAFAAIGTPQFSSGYATWISLALDSSDTPIVAFSDGDNGNSTTVMKWNGSAWTLIGSAGFSAGSAEYNSLAVDSSDNPIVAFSDGGNGNRLTVKKWDGANWTTVGSEGLSVGNVGYIGMEIDSSDNIFLAYKDHGKSGRVAVKKWDASLGSWEDLDLTGLSSGSVSDISLILDNDDQPVIAYKDSRNSFKVSVLKYTN